MGKSIPKMIILVSMLIGMPLLGIFWAGYDVLDYLEFPPQTHYVNHAPFSMPVFLGLGLFVFGAILPFIIRSWAFMSNKSNKSNNIDAYFPWWGHVGLIVGFVSWLLAWTRFNWFEFFQTHTFIPLWLSYILVVNALTKKRKGRCLMTRQPKAFMFLFPASIVFWWFFEYLNRFVQNWHYIEVSRFSAVEYFLLASLSFAMVLPAVLSTREFLLTFPFFERAFGSYVKVSIQRHKLLAWTSLIIAAIGLVWIGRIPDYLFPLIWVSPLVIIVSIQAIHNETHIFSDLKKGRWTMVIVSAMAALICGFFWEMWNCFSQAKWGYSVPFVQRFHLFEMPLLGYAGYIPFGLVCAVIGDFIVSPSAFDRNSGWRVKLSSPKNNQGKRTTNQAASFDLRSP